MAKQNKAIKFKVTNKSPLTQKKKTEYFLLGDFSFKEFEAFEGTNVIEGLLENVLVLGIAITLLCQVSVMRKFNNYPHNVDTTDTFKTWKARVFRTDIALGVILAAAARKSIQFYENGDDPDAISNILIMELDSWQGSRTYIKNLTSKNAPRWRQGYASRLQGIVNSCPSNNIEIFGLSEETTLKLKLKDIPALLGIDKMKSAPKLGKAVEILKEILFEEGDITLNEPTFTNATNYCPLEMELRESWGTDKYTRINSEGPSTDKPSTGRVLESTLSKYLNPLELAVYNNSVATGNRKKMNQMIDRAIERSQPTGQTLTVDPNTQESNIKGLPDPDVKNFTDEKGDNQAPEVEDSTGSEPTETTSEVDTFVAPLITETEIVNLSVIPPSTQIRRRSRGASND